MGLLSLFSKNQKRPDVTGSFSFLGADMHSHLLPGLDDGSKSVEESIDYISTLSALGYKKLICTPHIISDLYFNNRETIEPAYELLKQAVADAGLDIELGFAAEFMINPEFSELVQQGKMLPFGDNYLLVEMGFLSSPPNIKEVIFDLIIRGFKPVLAHPERYSYLHNSFEVIQDFAANGCLLQINLLSLTGHYGKPVKQTAERMIKEKIVSFAGTDLHHERHLGLLQHMAADRKIMDQLEAIDWKNKTL